MTEITQKIKELVLLEALPILQVKPLYQCAPPLIISDIASSVSESFVFPVIGKSMAEEGVTLDPSDGENDFGL